jgi:opacity protein-like surface antigen
MNMHIKLSKKFIGVWLVVMGLFAVNKAVVQGGIWKSFENKQISDSTFIYEQRVHRNAYVYFKEAQIRNPEYKKFTPMFSGVPMGTYSQSNGHIQYDVKSPETKNFGPWRNGYKLDFWVQPIFAAIFGNLEKSVESKTSILLNTQILLTKGLSLYTGVLFPLVNDLDAQPLNIRFAPTYFNYFFHKNTPDFVSVSAGAFYNDRYGVNLQYQHMDFNKRLSFGFEGSYSGYYYLYPTSYKYTNLRETLLLANIAYRFPRNDLSLNVEFGQFLHNDRGARLEFIRQYTKAEVTFFGSFTGNGATIGLNLGFKIPPGQALENNTMRLRTADEFRWEYVYSRGFKIAEDYRLNYNLNQKLRQYNRSFWSNQIIK